jgi:hypothetical protein
LKASPLKSPVVVLPQVSSPGCVGAGVVGEEVVGDAVVGDAVVGEAVVGTIGAAEGLCVGSGVVGTAVGSGVGEVVGFAVATEPTTVKSPNPFSHGLMGVSTTLSVVVLAQYLPSTRSVTVTVCQWWMMFVLPGHFAQSQFTPASEHQL